MPNKPAAWDDPFKGIKSGSWTRWGGPRQGLIRSEEETWFCQLCSDEQPGDFPGFFIEDEQSGEFVKLCAKCFHKSRNIHYSFRRTMILIKSC